jgi:hypothetical protein
MNPALIAEIAALIAQLGPLGLQLFLKLEGALNLGSDEKANIANAIAAANAADQDVLTSVAAWMQANGFKPVTTFVPVTPKA